MVMQDSRLALQVQDLQRPRHPRRTWPRLGRRRFPRLLFREIREADVLPLLVEVDALDHSGVVQIHRLELCVERRLQERLPRAVK